jgi:NTE family protein
MSERTDRSKRIALVLQGGGARGAYHVGVIKAIAEITACRMSPFQIVCGSSVGAINAASVAMTSLDFQTGAARLEALWRSLQSASIYDARPLPVLWKSSRWAMTLVLGHLGVRMNGGLLDYSPLHDLLKREFSQKHLRRAIKSKALHALCITTSSYTTGTSDTFFQGDETIMPWTRARRRGERATILPEHILASSALPLAFAPVHLNGGYFGDGALRSTSPLSPAIRTGADRILVVATRDGFVGSGKDGKVRPSPSIGEILGHALDILFNDNLEADVERTARINHTISLLTDDARTQTPLRIIETESVSPSKDLRDIAKLHANELPRSIRLLMRSIGYSGGDGRIESYLMFEPGYVGALIDLGYADTIAKADALSAFLKA